MDLPGIRLGVRAAVIRNGSILLVEFDDETGPHFNLPGGGVQPGESLHDALRREVREECAADVEVGPLLLAWEYVPAEWGYRYGRLHKVVCLFRCTLSAGSEPRLPERPDPNQTAVRWLPLTELLGAPLLPKPDVRFMEALTRPVTSDPFWRQQSE